MILPVRKKSIINLLFITF